MTQAQHDALKELTKALVLAIDTSLLDEIAIECNLDIINEFCDAVEAIAAKPITTDH